MMHITLQKKELRKELKAKRAAISETTRKQLDKAIHETFLKTTTFRLTDTRLISNSVGSEVDTSQIIKIAGFACACRAVRRIA